ncbi:hypothetical protein SCB49_00085 [unidentified eubacterium SCB49]|nr:hypothetical protein SCB49_00085 [unidentified eubacterium SCB49]
MTNYFILLLLIINTGLSVAQNNESLNQETKTLFELQVNTDKYIVEDGEVVDINGKLKNPKITIKQLVYKKFNAGNLEFKYPSNFSFEVEKSEGYSNWTLDGNNYVVMIFDIDGDSQLTDIIEEMISQFGREKCSTKEIETNIGDKLLNGIELLVELVGQKTVINFYQYHSSNTNNKYIAFQDNITEDGEETKESVLTLKMISDSIIYK